MGSALGLPLALATAGLRAVELVVFRVAAHVHRPVPADFENPWSAVLPMEGFSKQSVVFFSFFSGWCLGNPKGAFPCIHWSLKVHETDVFYHNFNARFVSRTKGLFSGELLDRPARRVTLKVHSSPE